MAYTDIDKATDYFTTFLWTGDGASTRSITGVGLQTDMMWSKIRNVGHQHNIVDTVRGVNQRLLMPNEDGAEDTTGTQGYFNSLDSDGFSLTYGGAGGYNTNRSGEPYVGWFWKANGSGSSNTDGSITSTVSANTTSGFSIVSYTGTGANATVGHGLGVAPQVFIIKNRSVTSDWTVYHHSLTNAEQVSLFLNLNFAVSGTSSARYNNTAPTSSVFSLGSGSYYNGSSNNMIAYCFAEKKGFSKFGSYTGNGNADGSFIYTGFSPSFVMLKASNSEKDWWILDSKRDSFNQAEDLLKANSSDAETTFANFKVDFLSNGFKLRGDTAGANGSGISYIYMAFAREPFTTSTGIPTTAR